MLGVLIKLFEKFGRNTLCWPQKCPILETAVACCIDLEKHQYVKPTKGHVKYHTLISKLIVYLLFPKSAK